MKRRIKRRIGDIVEIPLGDGHFAYGQVLVEPLIAFFAARSAKRLNCMEILTRPVAFSLLVMNYAVTDGDWEVIDHAAVSQDIDQRPPFFKWDNISKKLFVTYDGSEEIPADLESVQGLERCAVWEPEHVVERLNDHFAGRPCAIVERMTPPAMTVTALPGASDNKISE